MHSYLSCKAKVRLRNNGEASASWHFVTLSKKIRDEVNKLIKDKPRKGRGSVKIQAHIGYCKRKTSIFPSKPHNSYLLPIKADIRKELAIKDGDTIMISIQIL